MVAKKYGTKTLTGRQSIVHVKQHKQSTVFDCSTWCNEYEIVASILCNIVMKINKNLTRERGSKYATYTCPNCEQNINITLNK